MSDKKLSGIYRTDSAGSSSSFRNSESGSAVDGMFPGDKYVSRRSRNVSKKKKKGSSRSLSPAPLRHTKSNSKLPLGSLMEPEETSTVYAESKYVHQSTSNILDPVDDPCKKKDFKEAKEDKVDPVIGADVSNFEERADRAERAEAAINFSHMTEIMKNEQRRRWRVHPYWYVIFVMFLAVNITGLIIVLSCRYADTDGTVADETTERAASGSTSANNTLPTHIDHAPDHLPRICSSEDPNDRNECESFCEQAECCWKDGVEECLTLFLYRCVDYAKACTVLNEPQQ